MVDCSSYLICLQYLRFAAGSLLLCCDEYHLRLCLCAVLTLVPSRSKAYTKLTHVQGWGNGKPLPLLRRCPKQHGWPPYCRLTRPTDCHRHGISETLPAYQMSRRTPAWVVPRRSGARDPRVSDRAPSNAMRSRARGAADPAPRPLDCGCSRRRAKNGVLARRRHAGHLISAPQVSTSLCRYFVGLLRCFFGASLCHCVVVSLFPCVVVSLSRCVVVSLCRCVVVSTS